MNIESYRVYKNRPKSLMRFPIYYVIPDCDIVGVDIDEEIRKEHPVSEIKHLRHAAWTYIGVITEEES